MKTCDFSSAKIGDKVFALKYGWGIIISNKQNYTLQIDVKFNNINNFIYNFTNKGFGSIDDLMPSLFWQPFEIPDIAFQKPLQDLKVDTKVVV